MLKKLLILMFLASSSLAAEYYVATDGNDTTGDGSTGTPWATFAFAFGEMSAGDTLWIKDGTYTEQMTGLPDGTSGAYTFIKAVNDFSVTVVGGLYGNGDDYVHIQGIHFDGGGVLAGATHIKIIKCSFYNVPTTDWNIVTFCTTSGCTDILLEDCFAYGTGRYKFLLYNSERVILRRCVARHDFHPSSQCALFHRYNTTNCDFQNCIAIDSGLPDQSNGIMYGAFYADNHDPVTVNTGKDLGNITLNMDDGGVSGDIRIYGTRTVENCVGWDCAGAGYALANYDTPGPANAYVNHCTFGNLNGMGISQADLTDTMEILSASNTIITQTTIGLDQVLSNDYNCFYDNDTNYGRASAGAHDNTNNPGLQYLPLAPSGAGNASDSGYIGATILYQYGVSGTLWGETGYETLTEVPLWPFPNEDVIRDRMADVYIEWEEWTASAHNADAGAISGDRGFCEQGALQLNGTDEITLTSYIWEYLGNEMPAEIYGKSEPVRRRLSISGGITISGGVQLK